MAIDLALKRQGEKAQVIVTLHSKKNTLQSTTLCVKSNCFENGHSSVLWKPFPFLNMCDVIDFTLCLEQRQEKIGLA